ncbi:hypothetical protein ScPMuIL_011644 [Solemya velum]
MFFSSSRNVIIHEPGVEPDTLNDGFFVPPGVAAFGRIYTTKYKFLPSPYNAFEGVTCEDRVKINGTLYSYSKCLAQCRREILLKKCGCLCPLKSDVGPFCTLQVNKDCLGMAAYSILYDPDVEAECDCPLPCESTTYGTQVTYGAYPSMFINEVFKNLFGDHDFSRNFLELRLYFDSHMMTTVEQLPQYTSLGSVLANVGGQIGLFLGASIISVIELLELIVLVVRIYSRKAKNKTHVIAKNSWTK